MGVEITIQCDTDSLLSTGEIENLCIGSAGHAHLSNMDSIPAFPAQQSGSLWRQPLVKQNSLHATWNHSIRSSRFAAAN
jgi:hypothetical protein